MSWGSLPSIGLLLLSGCVSGTVYQRATALQSASAGPEEIERAMSDPNWKLRCLAARACGSTTHTACFARLSSLIINDDDGRVQSCSLDAVIARCETGGREILGSIGQPGIITSVFGPERLSAAPTASEFADGVVACPSADAVLTLAMAKHEVFREALLTLVPGKAPPTGPREQVSYLRAVAQLPAPRDRTEQAFREAQATASQLAVDEALEAARQESARVAAEEARLAEQKRLEAEAAAAEESKRQRDARWGPFAEWRLRPKNKELVGVLTQLAKAVQRRAKMQELYDKEKSKNDEAERDDDIQVLPLFPELSDNFTYLKALDRGSGEALFMAGDGPFVLRLSPGDSFTAAPGDLVYLTMFATGERMLMTTGARLPVFTSGRAPTRVRRIPGFKPNRSREKALSKRIDAEVAGSLALVRRQVERGGQENEGQLRGQPGGTLYWNADGEARAEFWDGSMVYCVELGLSCNSSGEVVTGDQLVDGK